MISNTEIGLRSIFTSLLIMGVYGYTSYFTRTHTYVSERMNWTEAQQYCRLYHDDLSTVSRQTEAVSLSVLGSKPTSCSNSTKKDTECKFGSWIGLYTEGGNSASWQWSGHDDLSFTMWGKNEPAKSGSCGYYDLNNAYWYSASCSLNLTFICMDLSPQLILVKSKKTWAEALDYCRSFYTDLASLLSDYDNTRAVVKSQAAEEAYVWTGLHFVVKYWIWMSGNALEYQAWSEKEQYKCPSRNFSCGALGTQEQTWKPRDCEDRLSFLCIKN